jgi:hypothetical protein
LRTALREDVGFGVGILMRDAHVTCHWHVRVMCAGFARRARWGLISAGRCTRLDVPYGIRHGLTIMLLGWHLAFCGVGWLTWTALTEPLIADTLRERPARSGLPRSQGESQEGQVASESRGT